MMVTRDNELIRPLLRGGALPIVRSRNMDFSEVEPNADKNPEGVANLQVWVGDRFPKPLRTQGRVSKVTAVARAGLKSPSARGRGLKQ